MRYAVFSDIHSNLEAFKRVLESIKGQGVDKCICLGDVVGYGPFPNECVALVKEHCHVCVLGNHDNVALGREESATFNLYAQQAIEWTRRELTPVSRSIIVQWPYTKSEGKFLFVHASPWSPGDWNYVEDLKGVEDSFFFFNEPICFIGHSHKPMIAIMEDSKTYNIYKSKYLRILPTQRLIINVGSVGQPRDRNPAACWCLVDTEEMFLQFYRVPYSIKSTQDAMTARAMNKFSISRLGNGV